MENLEIEVWLEVGREGRSFTYCDKKKLFPEVGDIVSVFLRGRLMNGLVIDTRPSSTDFNERIEKNPLFNKRRSLNSVEAIVQKAAVDSSWREWIQTIANKYYTSQFRMLKTALPSGWLGQKVSSQQQLKKLWMIYISKDVKQNNNLSRRESDLKSFLESLGGNIWQKDLLKSGFSSSFLNKCLLNGLIKREKKVASSFSPNEVDDTANFSLSNREHFTLTQEQEAAICKYLELPPAKALLLWGVTGSGKTEIYLRIVANELLVGKHCLVLTPEIGLIPQLLDRFKSRFGSLVVEYHSGCSEKERILAWRQLLNSKQPMVVVGTRSAIFLPLCPLGVVILDEEHDSSYKQESPMPCYHAREIALDRAKKTNAKVVLGSATPSLSSWKNLDGGSIELVKLSRRIANQSMPKVKVVDMREELANGNRGLVSRLLFKYLSELSGSGEQAVVLVPRRGYNSFISCRSCGEVVQCPHCDVSLTVHGNSRGDKWLRCHWCDYRSPIGVKCEACGSLAFKPFGSGTQRVFDYLSNEFPSLRFLRFDRDTTGGRDGHRRLLEKFGTGDADVLIGTQMLSKGMDLPGVTLAVVLAADGLLHQPDLCSEEQTLQLFMQLAGRAGRGEKPGRVIIQTYSPHHPVIQHFVDGDYEKFLQREAMVRRESNLIPFSRACLLRLSSETASLVTDSAYKLANFLKPICEEQGWIVVGPAPALVQRVGGKTRWQILLHGPEESYLPLPDQNIIWSKIPKGVHLSINPDPLQL